MAEGRDLGDAHHPQKPRRLIKRMCRLLRALSFLVVAFQTSGQLTAASNALGTLVYVGPAPGWAPGSNLWIANAHYASNANGIFSFSLYGGGAGENCEFFGIRALGTSNAWTRLGSGPAGGTFAITHTSGSPLFVTAAAMIDSDGDGVTDGVERFITRTNPLRADPFNAKPRASQTNVTADCAILSVDAN